MSGNVPNGGRDPEDVMAEWATAALRGAGSYVIDPQTGRAKDGWQFVPVLAPALDAVADFREGNYGGAALNGAFAAMDVLPWASAGKIVRLGAAVGAKNLLRTDLTHKQALELMKKGKLIGEGQEMHHSIEVGKRRHFADWRNSLLLMKPMNKSLHRRLRGRWGDAPRHPQPQRIWHQTNHWQKNIPAGIASYAGNRAENNLRFPSPTPRR